MLANDDILILMDALDAWERVPAKDDILSDVFMSILLGGSEDPEAKEEFKRRSSERGEAARLEVHTRKEQVIMLKAKLLKMCDASVVDEGTMLLRNGGE